jgi:hypothetical protein
VPSHFFNFTSIHRHRSLGSDKILVELIRAGSNTLCCEVHKLIGSVWDKEELSQWWKESIIVPDVRFEVFTAVMIQVKVLWVMTLCSVVVGCKRFRGPCCLHLQGEWREHGPLKTSAFYRNTTWHHNPEDPNLHYCTFYKTDCSNYTEMSLLATAYKILPNILLSGLTAYIVEIIGYNRYGFGCNKSTTDQIFWICQILEKKWEYYETVYQLYVDFKEACHLVRREVLYSIFIDCGMPTKLVSPMKMCLNETYIKVCIGRNLYITYSKLSYMRTCFTMLSGRSKKIVSG